MRGRQLLREIVRRGLALYRRVEREQDLARGRCRALHEACDVQPVGAPIPSSGDRCPTSTWIEAVDDARPLQRPQVADFFHHHDHALITARILADAAGIDGVDVGAVRALDDLRAASVRAAARGSSRSTRRFKSASAALRAEREPAPAAAQKADQPLDFCASGLRFMPGRNGESGPPS